MTIRELYEKAKADGMLDATVWMQEMHGDTAVPLCDAGPDGCVSPRGEEEFYDEHGNFDENAFEAQLVRTYVLWFDDDHKLHFED